MALSYSTIPEPGKDTVRKNDIFMRSKSADSEAVGRVTIVDDICVGLVFASGLNQVYHYDKNETEAAVFFRPDIGGRLEIVAATKPYIEQLEKIRKR